MNYEAHEGGGHSKGASATSVLRKRTTELQRIRQQEEEFLRNKREERLAQIREQKEWEDEYRRLRKSKDLTGKKHYQHYGVKISWTTQTHRERQMRFHNNAIKNSTSYVGKEVRDHWETMTKKRSLFFNDSRKIVDQKEKQKRIDLDNRLLFERLQRLPKTEISAVNDANSLEKKLYHERKTAREKSVRKAKQWKLNYINSENRLIAQRIKASRSAYDHKSWEGDFKRHEKIKKHMARVAPRRKRHNKRHRDKRTEDLIKASTSAPALRENLLGGQSHISPALGGTLGGGSSEWSGGGNSTKTKKDKRKRRGKKESNRISLPALTRAFLGDHHPEAAGNRMIQRNTRRMPAIDLNGSTMRRAGDQFDRDVQRGRRGDKAAASRGTTGRSAPSGGASAGGGKKGASGDRGQIMEQGIEIDGEYNVVSVFAQSGSKKKERGSHGGNSSSDVGRKLVFEAFEPFSRTFTRTSFSLENLLKLAEIYPDLLLPGQRIRMLIGMLRFDYDHAGKKRLVLDPKPFLEGLKAELSKG